MFWQFAGCGKSGYSNYIAIVCNTRSNTFSYYYSVEEADGAYSLRSIDKEMDRYTHGKVADDKSAFIDAVRAQIKQ